MSRPVNLASFGLLLSLAIGFAVFRSDQGKPVQAQTQRERVLTKRNFRNEPVRITKVAYKFSSRVKFGEPFIASDDWIPDITFDIQNVSRKTINYIRMEVGLFSSPTLDSPDIFIPINLGKDHVTFETEPVMSMKPGETGALWRVTPSDVRQAMKEVESAYSRRLPLDRAEVSISRVIFDDQTMWYHGSFHIRDINNPGVWMNLDILSKPDVLEQYRQYILTHLQFGSGVRKIGFNSPALKKTEMESFRTEFGAMLFGFGQLNIWKATFPATRPDGGCDFYEGAMVLIDSCSNPPCKALAPLILQDSCGNLKLATGSVFERCDQGGQECKENTRFTQVPRYLSCSQPDNDSDNHASTPNCGDDCCDSDPNVFLNAIPRCDGALNACGTQDWNCNGTADPQESACRSGPEGRQYNNCNDGIDNDGDGDIDFDDVDCLASPIIIDIAGNGYHLTGLSDPVTFDLFGDGKPLTIGWTARDEDDAFLVLDRNGNGRIDNGTELFGNVTSQPLSQNRNGFLALAEYDKPVNGGNGDGYIDNRDMVFSSLRLWQDINHNGISESAELHTLSESGVAILNLEYNKSRRIDMYGNQFKFRAGVKGTSGAHIGPWAWDVFFVFAL